jgi:hypothetical protein
MRRYILEDSQAHKELKEKQVYDTTFGEGREVQEYSELRFKHGRNWRTGIRE